MLQRNGVFKGTGENKTGGKISRQQNHNDNLTLKRSSRKTLLQRFLYFLKKHFVPT
jgi:hypothetical protein